ncbi:MAG TPA: SigB/SigF/SigG family RNA polymerase sigma factor [Solirubrobacteraceae bacterium]|nr:SigB/SigF/SigG family RNA polymerase sigma factor [Solirubrobacteraceae bacterium]
MAAIAPAKPTLLPPAQDDLGRLFLRWQQDGDASAREALLERFMPLARSLARRYERSSEPLEDLLQVASLGLLKALDRFDPARGYPFASFAVPTILGEMRRHFRDAGWSVHVPRGVQERALKVRDAHERVTNERGRAPTVNQLAQYLELDAEEVLEAMRAIQAYDALSLDSPRPGAPDEESGVTYGETLGAEDERYELVELNATVDSVLDRVPPRERLILHLRFVEDLTQTEIAARVGISQMQVSRLLRRTLEQLRALTQAEREDAGAARLRPTRAAPG